MAEYLIAYVGEKRVSKAEGTKQMDRWKAWIERLGDAVVNLGTPLAQNKVVTEDGSVEDAGQTARITGFSIVKADDLDAALAIARDCPYLGVMGHVQVAQVVKMG